MAAAGDWRALVAKPPRDLGVASAPTAPAPANSDQPTEKRKRKSKSRRHGAATRKKAKTEEGTASKPATRLSPPLQAPAAAVTASAATAPAAAAVAATAPAETRAQPELTSRKKAKKVKQDAASAPEAPATAEAGAQSNGADAPEPGKKAKKKKRDAASRGAAEDDVATHAAEYLRSWDYHVRKGSPSSSAEYAIAPPRWKFKSNTQAWLIRNALDAARVRDETFSLLLVYAAGIQGRAREFAQSTAKEAEHAAGEASLRALHYGPSDMPLANAQKNRAGQLLDALATTSS
jgi:hypothetical protein